MSVPTTRAEFKAYCLRRLGDPVIDINVDDEQTEDRTIPYTYLIGWSKQQKYYYGVRFAKKCTPSDLWDTYFTSSKYVKKFREKYGEPDIIQIRKIFNTQNDAIIWESRVLKKLNVTKREEFLNKWDGKHCDIEILKAKKSKEHAEKISKALTGRKHLSGKSNPMYGKRGEKSPHWNVPKSKEHAEKISKALKGKKYTEERKRNMSLNCPKNSLGKKWYHNPETMEQRYFFENEQPNNWVKGRGNKNAITC